MLWNLSNFPRAAADRCWKAARTWNCCCCSTLLTILLPPPSQLLTTSSRHITSSSSSSKDDVDDPASARLRQKTFLKVTFSVGKILSQNRVYSTFNTLHSLQGQEKNMGLNQLAVAVCWCNHKSLQGTLLKVNVQCAKPILGPPELLQILDVWCWGPWTNTSFKLISPGTHRFSGVHCESKTIHYLLSLLPVLGEAQRLFSFIKTYQCLFDQIFPQLWAQSQCIFVVVQQSRPFILDVILVGLAFFSTITSLAR